jgi:hypothetical protein
MSGAEKLRRPWHGGEDMDFVVLKSQTIAGLDSIDSLELIEILRVNPLHALSTMVAARNASNILPALPDREPSKFNMRITSLEGMSSRAEKRQVRISLELDSGLMRAESVKDRLKQGLNGIVCSDSGVAATLKSFARCNTFVVSLRAKTPLQTEEKCSAPKL